MAATENALERVRSRLLIAVTGDRPIKSAIPELTRMLLEEIEHIEQSDGKVSGRDAGTGELRIYAGENLDYTGPFEYNKGGRGESRL